VRTRDRGLKFFALTAVTAIAVMTAGCSSGASTAGDPPHATVASTDKPKTPGQAILNCLAAHDVTKATLQELYFGSVTTTAGVTPTELRVAGEDCWQKAGTGLLATAFRRIDTCLGIEGITTAHTGSPLADVLLEVDAHSQKAKSALQFCLRT
jgi:hypothetical protein